MSTPPLSVNQSREQVWMSNFNTISKFYKENGHLSIRCPRLQQWLSYQRHHTTTLRKDQLEKLESIRYDDVSMYRDCDEIAWETKFSELKDSRDKDGKIKAMNRALSSWLARQRRYFKNDRLDPERKRKLEELGIDLSLSIEKSNRKRINEENHKRWMANYNKLKEYKRLNGHCNVPRRNKDDPTLGNWVFNQRTSCFACGLPKVCFFITGRHCFQNRHGCI